MVSSVDIVLYRVLSLGVSLVTVACYALRIVNVNEDVMDLSFYGLERPWAFHVAQLLLPLWSLKWIWW